MLSISLWGWEEQGRLFVCSHHLEKLIKWQHSADDCVHKRWTTFGNRWDWDCYKEIAIQVLHKIVHFLSWTETQKGCPDLITNQTIGQINRWFKRTPVQQGLALSCGKVIPSLKFYVLSKESVLYNVGLLWKVILLFSAWHFYHHHAKRWRRV